MPITESRLYLTSEAAAVDPALNPSGVGANWNTTTQAERKRARFSKGSSSNQTKTMTALVNGQTHLAIQFVSDACGWTAPSIVASGIFRAATDLHAPPKVVRLSMSVFFVSNDGTAIRGPSGAIETAPPPTIYYSGPYVDSLSLQAEARSYGNAFASQWHSADPSLVQLVTFPTVIPTDRLVVSIGFFPSGTGPGRTPSIEYGEGSSDPLSLADVNASGYGFVDIFRFVEADAVDESGAVKPFRAAHRPVLLSRYETPAGPFGGTSFLGE